MSNNQTDFVGFEDTVPATYTAKAAKKENDLFFNGITYTSSKGVEHRIQSAFGLQKGRSQIEDLIIEILEECDTDEERVKEANNFFKRLSCKSVWLKSDKPEKKAKLTKDDL